MGVLPEYFVLFLRSLMSISVSAPEIRVCNGYVDYYVCLVVN